MIADEQQTKTTARNFFKKILKEKVGEKVGVKCQKIWSKNVGAKKETNEIFSYSLNWFVQQHVIHQYCFIVISMKNTKVNKYT